MTGVFHIHTCYSFDAFIHPKRIVAHLRRLGFDFAAITDHETIKGALEAKRLTINDLRLTIIVGAEYSTEKGDIIGLFLKSEIVSKKSDKVISEIKKQGGLVVLPHPYRGHKLDDKLIGSVDVIEVYNSRSTELDNQKSLELARKYGKPMIAGSDAHFLGEIGLTKMDFAEDKPRRYFFRQESRPAPTSEARRSRNGNESDIKLAILNGGGSILFTKRSPIYYKMLTGLTRLCKTKDPRIPISWMKKFFSH